MPSSEHREPSPFLLEPGYWRERVARLGTVNRGLLLLPRPDLSTRGADVIEWRLKAHDGIRLWGLRAQSPFHPEPTGARIREVCCGELPEVDHAAVGKGEVEFVFQVPAGRRLEDRVLDVLRVFQVVMNSGLDPDRVQLANGHDEPPDEFMIARELLEAGLFNDGDDEA